MRNLKLGMKIGIGFGILILIACSLGGMAVFNMTTVEKDAKKLSKSYDRRFVLPNSIKNDS